MSEREEVVGGMNTNRHASEFDDFAWCVQRRLNKHVNKKPLTRLSADEVTEIELEEDIELDKAVLAGEDARHIEHEAIDKAIGVFCRWLWARRGCPK